MKYLLFTLFLFIVIAINAQTELSSSFNSTHSGRNVTFALSKTYNARHELGGGIRFNINKLEMSDDQNKVYMKRLYATMFYHHLGIEGFYHYHVFRNWTHIKPFFL